MTRPTPSAGFVDPDDLVQFERLGMAWWDERGAMAALHRLNPVRVRYVRDRVVQHFGASVGGDTERGTLPLAGLSVLDIGCGGGLLSEPLTRLGARVTGIDPAPGNVDAARAHAAAVGLSIDYRAATVEDLAVAHERFDVVIASEVVEHVLDQPAFTAAACGLAKPNGLFLVSTLNRTAKAFLLAIVGAEYVLGWLPRGTHRWDRFVRPGELARWVRPLGFRPVDVTGMVFDPLENGWRFGRDSDVNYWFAAARPS
jgi:2-polyprenyl-6-hydroxyphenyl methylase / 3-demethylubiquinone-9 3-methyltransferase